VWLQTLLMFYQEINVQNMNVELVAQMFQNYQSNVLFHLEGTSVFSETRIAVSGILMWHGNSDGQPEGPSLSVLDGEHSPARTLHTTGWVNSDVRGMTSTVAGPCRARSSLGRKGNPGST